MKKILLFTSILFLTISTSLFAQQHPINLASSNITSSSVDLSWDASMCTGVVYLQFRITGSGGAGWTLLTSGVSSPYVLSGLIPTTSYDFEVQCAGIAGWSNTYSFTTLNTPIIDSVLISDSIDCFGGNADVLVYVTQTTPSLTNIQYKNYRFNANNSAVASYGSSLQTTAIQIPFNVFAGDYLMLVVDSVLFANNAPPIPPNSNYLPHSNFVLSLNDPSILSYYYYSIPEPDQLVASTSVVASNQCAGDSIAEEDLVISGGTMPYSFDIISSNGTTTQNLTNGVSAYSFVALWSGNYDVFVTDANGCSTTPSTTTFIIAPIAPIVPAGSSPVLFGTTITYNVSCNGANDGSITAAATGGTGAFTYSIDGNSFQSSAVFPGLLAGTYTVTYKDTNNCIVTEQLTLNEPPAFSGTASVTQNVDCFGASTGEITFTVDPLDTGVPPYDYSLDNFTTSQPNNPVFDNLYGDSTYSVMIEDNNGCQHTSTVYLAEPTELIYSTTLSNYNGFEVSCAGATDGSIDFTTTSGGLAPYDYSLDGGGTFDSATNYSNLSSLTTYNIVVRDASLCTETSTIDLDSPGVFSIPFVISNLINCPVACDGAVSINESNGVGNILYDLDGGTPQSTPYFAGLCGDITNGFYILNAIDDNSCQATATITIPEPAAFVAVSSSTLDYCTQSNGTASISVTSGWTGGYLYEWNTTPIQNSAVANNLSAGTYSVTVTDANSCQFSESVTVGAAQGFTISFTTLSPCLGPNSGSATVSATGTAPYTYQWSDVNGIIAGETSAIISNIPVGAYSVDVTDATTCTITGNVDVIPPINSIILDTVVVTNSSCYGIDDAQIEIFASGGQLPYSYSSNGSIPQFTPVFGMLPPTTYAINAIDANGCFDTINITLSYPGILQIDSTIHTDVSCFGLNDAAIQGVNVFGGTSPFMYSVDGSTHYSNMAYFNGYGPGTHTIEVFDVNNCVSSDIITISEPDILDVTITTSGWVFNPNSNSYSFQIKCNGDNSGFANIAISGGTGPFIKNCYANGVLVSSSTNPSITGLVAGVYTFEIIDANGCTYTEVITYSQPSPIVHNFIPTHVTCNDWSNGSLTGIVTGGVGSATSYVYAWNTGDSTYTITEIPVGQYTMTVKDDNNCISVASFNINDNNALSASALGQNVSCFDYCDGVITTNAIGGMPNYDINGNPVYMYQWNDILLQTTQNAIGLCVDNLTSTSAYSCVITDAQGCELAVNAVINQPDELIASSSIVSNYNLQDISCYGENDGIASVSVLGGNSPFDFIWSTGLTQNNVLISTINSLLAGTHTVVVKDSKGCMDTTSITLTQPTEVTLSVSQINIYCYGKYDGSITADADGGTPVNGIPPMYNYSFSNLFNEQVDISTSIDLGPGIYTVTATDANGCSITSASLFISQPSDSLTISLDSIDETCALDDGEVTAFVLGGTQPYNYDWSNGSNGNIPSLNLLPPTYYSVIITDANGCVITDETRVVGVQEIFLPNNVATIDTTICLGSSVFLPIEVKPNLIYIWSYNMDTLYRANSGNYIDVTFIPTDPLNVYVLSILDPNCASPYEVSVTINVEDIDPMPASNPGVEYGDYPIVLAGDNIDLFSNNNTCVEYTWQWNNEAITNANSLITIPELTATDWYYLNVKDVDGCLGYDSIYVVVGVKPYEAITPNNDGFNDTWTPLDIRSYQDALVQVFNRWGGLVFESNGGVDFQAWDGTNNGKELAVGTYYYIIDLNTGDVPQTGPVTIIR